MSAIVNVFLGQPNDGNGDPLRTGGTAINANFAALNADKLETGGYAGTAQDLSDAIANVSTNGFVSLSTVQTVTGQKIFSGGLAASFLQVTNQLNLNSGVTIELAPSINAITINKVIGTETYKFINGMLAAVEQN